MTGVTAEHPYWVRGKGWVEVKDLKQGDQLTGHDGQIITVQSKVLEKKPAHHL